jgi:LAS superfamily LD-carboxypeptidase LdcB
VEQFLRNGPTILLDKDHLKANSREMNPQVSGPLTAIDNILVGHSEAHLVDWQDRKIHKDMQNDLAALTEAARAQGFILQIASAFRGFDRQLEIWNSKVSGKSLILDDNGQTVNITNLQKSVLLTKVLRWLALPGSSRHHWGTDIDVFDQSAIGPDYKLQLSLQESETVFKKFHAWLDQNITQFGFFRPYAKDLGGVNREPWHLSYAPVAEVYFERYSFNLLESVINETEIHLKNEILNHLPEIYTRFVRNISPIK